MPLKQSVQRGRTVSHRILSQGNAKFAWAMLGKHGNVLRRAARKVLDMPRKGSNIGLSLDFPKPSSKLYI